MNGFEEIGQNGCFWAKMAIFGPFLAQNGENKIFFAKKRNCHFLTFIEPGLHEKKSEKSHARISRKLMTDGRMSANP